MSAEDTKAIVRWMQEEIWLKGNIDVADEFFASNWARSNPHPTAPLNLEAERHRIAGGKIVESMSIWDQLGLLQQLSVFPAPGQAGW